MKLNLNELLKSFQTREGVTITATETLFNGVASGGLNGIDNKDGDDLLVIVNAGIFAGDGTLNVEIHDSDTNDSSTSAVVANTAMTEVNDGQNENQQNLAYYRTQGLKRFLWVRTVKAGTGSAGFGVITLQGMLQTLPSGQTLDKELKGTPFS